MDKKTYDKQLIKRAMKELKWLRSFREQGIECARTGNRFIVKDPFSTHEVIVCAKFKTQCMSRVCRYKRLGVINDDPMKGEGDG